VPNKAKPSNDQLSDQEIARRRDAVIKHMLSTPPKPHSEMKVGKSGKGPSVQKKIKKKVK
jgi:hypothetical protein